MTRTQRE